MPTRVTTRTAEGRRGIGTGTVRRRADAMLEALGQGEAELSVLLCDDATIAELNGRYRDKPRATDVLSFPLTGADGPAVAEPPGQRQPVLLGDIVISLPRAARQAPKGADGLRSEVTRLLAHGLLHLLGQVHDTDRRRKSMELETERLMAAAEPR